MGSIKITNQFKCLKICFGLGLALALGLLSWTQEVRAQYAGSMGSMYNTISFASQSLSISQNSYYDTLHRGQRLGSSSSAPAHRTYATTPSNPGYSTAPSNPGNVSQAPAPQQYPITATDFTPAPNRIVPDQLVNGMTNITNEQKEAVRNAYNQTLNVFETKIRKNNLANAFAFIVATSQQIIYQKQPSSEEIASLVNYYNNILANSPQFKTYSDQQKQILNESLILTSASMDALYTQGVQQNNLEAQKQAKDMAKSFLKSLAGINVD